jgi:hypothetical protein
VLTLEWSVLAVVYAYVLDGAADGFFAWVRARQARGGDPRSGDRDVVLVREFLKTYATVIVAMGLVTYMVFSGKLVKPGDGVPEGTSEPLLTWQFWAVVAAFVAARAFAYYWDYRRGREMDYLPPGIVVGEPLKRLFALQFGVMVGGLIVFWFLDSSRDAMVVLVLAVAATDVVLAVIERQRVARVQQALAAGEPLTRERAPREQPRGGRKRQRRR